MQAVFARRPLFTLASSAAAGLSAGSIIFAANQYWRGSRAVDRLEGSDLRAELQNLARQAQKSFVSQTSTFGAGSRSGGAVQGDEHDMGGEPVASGKGAANMDVHEDARTLKGLPPFQTTFAVPMHCQSCVDQVEKAIGGVEGISSISTSLPNQLVHITGTAAPSAIISALQRIGRDGILRGSGAPNSAAVAILETQDDEGGGASPVRGLVRAVQVAPELTLFDVSVTGLNSTSEEDSSEWAVSVRASGDISRGVASAGDVWTGADIGKEESNENLESSSGGSSSKRGYLGRIRVDARGKGSIVLVKRLEVWELIGRGLMVEKIGGGGGKNAVLGVIARSAGVWDNDKTVCSCSGKTVWEEREEQRGRGVL